jgi:transcriptional regulator with XRE-family HTH domain
MLRGFMTRTEFCVKFDLTQTTLRRYEVENRAPDVKTLNTIASHYQVSLDWLVNGTPPVSHHPNPTNLPASLLDELHNTQNMVTTSQPITLPTDTETERRLTTLEPDDWIFSLSFDEFDAFWDEYRKSSETRRGWIQCEILNKFPDFTSWFNRQRP